MKIDVSVVRIQRLFWFAFLILGSFESLYSETPKRLILTIGISSYEDSYWTPLKYSNKDAKDMKVFFSEMAEPKFDWHESLVTDPEAGKLSVNQKDILEAFEKLKEANTSEKDIVIVYISTHGTIDWKNGKLERFIVSSDSNSKNIANTALPYNDLVKIFRGLKSKKRALIMDYCHSGTGKSVLTPEMLLEMEKRKGAYYPEIESDEVEGEYILAASNWRQSAQESGALKNGVYTHFLLKGFEKDLNKDGAVSLTEAHSFARAATYDFTSKEQTPTASINLEGTDPIFISGNRNTSDKAFLFSFIKEFSDYRVIIDGKDKGILKKGVSVPSGKIRLKFVNPDTEEVKIDQVVRFREGAEYSVLNILSTYKSNHLDAGVIATSFLNNDIKNSHAPKTSTGFGIRYSRKNFWKIYDLYLYASKVQALDQIGDIERERLTYDVTAALGFREDLSIFSPSKRLIHNEFFTNIGPSLQVIQAQSNTSLSNEESTVAGLKASLGLNLLIPVVNLRTGIELSLGAYQSPFEDYSSIATVSQGFAYLGFQW